MIARPRKGEGRLVRADTNLAPEIAGEIADEARLLGQGASQLRRILIEEAWALYRQLGRQKFLERRATRLGLRA